MAKFGKLAASRFGTPPAPEDTPGNLDAPEIAPASPVVVRVEAGEGEPRRGRRKTGRTVMFATRVTEAFDLEFRKIADRDTGNLAKLLELSLEAYKREKQR
ncbi:MAG: hypothetical protein JO004_10910 [Methylobacteriaceae bacterium]|nr:hypothetical protein [Methylobacteriaceae bacterium]